VRSFSVPGTESTGADRSRQPALRHLPIEITAFLYCDNARPDFSGIVYHANYLRFMERGRTNHLRLMGAEQHALFAEAQAETPGFAFVVRSMQIDYLKPARMDDVLDVVTWPVAVKGASITLAQEVKRGHDLLVKAEVRVAFISEGRAQPIPKALRTLLKADL
jgi:acyl-CoA thioester hydrolase